MDKTALEEFAIALYEGGYLQGNGDEIQNLLEQHLEINKERLKDAFIEGANTIYAIPKTFDQFYNETYGGNK